MRLHHASFIIFFATEYFYLFFTNPFQTPMPGGSGVSNQEIALTEWEAGANRAILSKKRNSQKMAKTIPPKT